MNAALVIIIGFLAILTAWAAMILRKLNRLQEKEMRDAIYKQAHDDIASKSLTDLIDDDLRRRTLREDSSSRKNHDS